MKNQLLIALIVLPLGFTACGEKNKEATEKNDTDAIQIATTPEVPVVEESESSPAISGAVIGGILGEGANNPSEGASIGAAAGGIIGHQSGRALEGAAIGGAIGSEVGAEIINEEPDKPVEK